MPSAIASGLVTTRAIDALYALSMIAVFVGNSFRATMYAARIAAASGDAPQGDGGFDAKGRYGPSRTAFTASNIASCAMVVRICVRNGFSGTDAPSEMNRLPQSSSTAGPVNPAGKLAATAFGARAGDKPIRDTQAAIRTCVLNKVLIKISL